MNQIDQVINMCHLDWKNLIILLAILNVVWLLITGLNILLLRANVLKVPKSGIVIRILGPMRLYYPLFSALLIATCLISSCPMIFGTLFILIGFGFFPIIRQYMIGLVVRGRLNIKTYQDIIYQGEYYHVQEIHSLGLRVNSMNGERFIHYQNLYNRGFDLTSRRFAAVRSQILVRPTGDVSFSESLNRLRNLIFSSPYIDFFSKPQIVEANSHPGWIEINIIPKSRDDAAALNAQLIELNFELLGTSITKDN